MRPQNNREPSQSVARSMRQCQPSIPAALISALIVLLLIACSGGGSSPDTMGSSNASSETTVDDDPYPVRLLDTSDIEADITIEDDVGVVVRDGTRLSARVFRPAGSGRYPVVMAFTSYGKDRGPDEYPPVLDFSAEPEFDMGRFEVSSWTTWEGPDPAFWVPQGYAVVYVDARGYYASEGDASVISEQDRLDFHDVIDWAGTRPWSNGSVGLTGVSYLAISQWVAAGNAPTYLKAIMPWEGQTDAYREVLYHGGVPETAFTEFWVGRVNSGAATPPLPAVADFQEIHRFPPFMRQLLSRSPQAAQPSIVTVPALICATWSDHGLHTRGSFEGYKHIDTQQKWLYTHGRPKWSTYYSEEALLIQRDFFDHFLKGESNGFENTRSVRLEVRESLDRYEVRYEDDWPIPDTDYMPLFLNASSGKLIDTLTRRSTTVTYDPMYDNATFTVKFESDTEITGNMKLKLWVSTTQGEDMDLFVGIKKLDEEGNEVTFYAKSGYTLGPVALGWLRVSERELDEAKSTAWQPVLTHDNPQPIAPGEIVPVEIEILPSSTLFKAGESLQLLVQGADLFEHPSLAHAYSQEVNVGVHTIYSGGEYDSHLLIPVIP